MRDQWSAERVSLLKTLWKSGAPASAIAARLGGMSRSAVLGKLFRLRRRAGPTAALALRSPARARGRGKSEALPQPPPAAPRATGKTLLELTNSCCRWPHGRPGAANFFFCGAPGADLELGMPYCPRHAQRAYAQPTSNVDRATPAIPGSAAAPPLAPDAPEPTDIGRAGAPRPAPRGK
jgi:GcrA cell cycle regulator